MNLTDRFADALSFAERLHRNQTRKGNDIPYVAHLLAVAATVLEWGGDEDTAVAALLHDAVEDQGGLETADRIRERFGDRVFELVLACSDSVSANPRKAGPWEERKRAYIAKLTGADESVALITAADKLHNLRALVRDVKTHGPQTLSRFAVPDRLCWYYASVAEALMPHSAATPLAELEELVREFAELVEWAAPDAAEHKVTTQVPLKRTQFMETPKLKYPDETYNFPDIPGDLNLSEEYIRSRISPHVAAAIAKRRAHLDKVKNEKGAGDAQRPKDDEAGDPIAEPEKR